MKIDLTDLFPDTKNLDSRFVLALMKAIKNNHDNEFDYIKFKQSLLSLSQMALDEQTQFRSAFATASTMGLTKDKLLKSANQYVYVLDEEKDSFADAISNQIDTKVEGRRREVIELERKIKEHKEKIKELEREIVIFQNRIDTVDQDVEKASNKIEQTKTKFLAVYNAILNSIKKDIELIQTYL